MFTQYLIKGEIYLDFLLDAIQRLKADGKNMDDYEIMMDKPVLMSITHDIDTTLHNNYLGFTSQGNTMLGLSFYVWADSVNLRNGPETCLSIHKKPYLV